MTTPQIWPLHKIPILDESDYVRAELPLLALAKNVVQAAAIQATVLHKAPGLARLYNLTRWQSDGAFEYLDTEEITADVIIHIACHQAIHQRFGSQTLTKKLLGEAIASASDLYLVGCFANRGEETAFLEETLESYTFYYESYGEVGTLETLLERVMEKPHQVMAELAHFLFEFALWMLKAEKDQILLPAQLATLTENAFYPLVHHYHLSNWILTLKEHPAIPLGSLPAGIWQELSKEGGLEHLLNLECPTSFKETL